MAFVLFVEMLFLTIFVKSKALVGVQPYILSAGLVCVMFLATAAGVGPIAYVRQLVERYLDSKNRLSETEPVLDDKKKCWDPMPVLFFVDLFLPKQHADEIVDDLRIRYKKRFKSFGQTRATIWLMRHGMLSIRDARVLSFGAKLRSALMKAGFGAWLLLKYDLVREAFSLLITRH
ncbi:MAG TPA: hypothetical protein VJ835_12070 [Fimbriimonadaceae bacterium]|nr:hypothetical protein [Fimbriimonadaceae bacterium]